jgi:hypothetical protein
MEQTSRHRLTELPPAMLKQFFISHLNRIYCAKTQLADKLPLFNRRSGFPDLRLAISETITMAHHQIDRLKAIYFMQMPVINRKAALVSSAFLVKLFSQSANMTKAPHCAIYRYYHTYPISKISKPLPSKCSL